jgi:hypothetical protein
MIIVIIIVHCCHLLIIFYCTQLCVFYHIMYSVFLSSSLCACAGVINLHANITSSRTSISNFARAIARYDHRRKSDLCPQRRVYSFFTLSSTLIFHPKKVNIDIIQTNRTYPCVVLITDHKPLQANTILSTENFRTCRLRYRLSN